MKIKNIFALLCMILLCFICIGCDEHYSSVEKELNNTLPKTNSMYDLISQIENEEHFKKSLNLTGAKINVFDDEEILELDYQGSNEEYQYYVSLDKNLLIQLTIISGSSKAFSGGSDIIDKSLWKVDYNQLKEKIKEETGANISKALLFSDKWQLYINGTGVIEYDLSSGKITKEN